MPMAGTKPGKSKFMHCIIQLAVALPIVAILIMLSLSTAAVAYNDDVNGKPESQGAMLPPIKGGNKEKKKK